MNRILEVIHSLLKPQNYINLGANYDERDIENTSIPQSEVVGQIAIPSFSTKDRNQWRTYFQQHQSTSSACVAYTAAKIVSILYFQKIKRLIRFSPAWYYTQRSNKPDQGMVYGNIINLASKGSVVHELLPCEGFNENEINNIKIEEEHKLIATAFSTPPSWILLTKNFDTVASTVEKTGKGLMIWFQIYEKEWFNREIPQVISGSREISGHSVTLVDAFTYKGTEYLLIEDSADKSYWRKLITRDYFNKRCRIISYPLNFKFIKGGDKPSFNGTIVSAQQCFKYEGFFPANIDFVENWGKVTTESAKKFQEKYGLVKSGSMSVETVNKLRQLYP